ncbi:hypothetical protein D3C76_935200 [compost metagenome]
MFSTILYSDASLPAAHFITSADVWILKAPPAANVVNENGSEVTVSKLYIRQETLKSLASI